MVTADKGLNLKAVGELIKKVKTAKELEEKLNDKAVGLNNLDLNEDGNVDYIKVTEYGENNIRGFSLTTDLAPGETQEIATIEVEKGANAANVQVSGNHNIYGHNHHYHSSFGLTELLLVSYLFSPHPFYYSPYRYGYYPSYYSPYRTSPYSSYNSRVNNYNQSSSFAKSTQSNIKSKVESPNKSKTSSKIKAPLKNPSTSQRSFQSRNPSKQVRSGGFGSSRPSVRSGGFGRSGGSFGGK